MTPQQLIDLCRATNQPLPSGRRIAEVVEALVRDAVAAGRDWEACRGHYDTLMSDYAAVVAERDELARALLSGPHHCACPKFRNTTSGQERLPHFPGCPVALAERIVKEAGDGR